MIDREVIEYTSTNAMTLEGCKRGVAGTTGHLMPLEQGLDKSNVSLTSTGTISTNPLGPVFQRRVSTVAELQNGWLAGGVAFSN